MTRTQEAGTSGTDSQASTHTELARSPATQTFILQTCLRLLHSCEPCAAQHAVVIGTPAQLYNHIHHHHLVIVQGLSGNLHDLFVWMCKARISSGMRWRQSSVLQHGSLLQRADSVHLSHGVTLRTSWLGLTTVFSAA